MKYHISRAGKTYGPYSMAELHIMAAQGNLASDDLAWSDGLGSWIPANQVLGPSGPQFPHLHQPPASPPPSMSANISSSPGIVQNWVASYRMVPPQVMPGAGPIPPSLHWVIVLLLGIMTCSIFFYIWPFVQSDHARRIDPNSNATLLNAVWFGLALLGVVILQEQADAVAIGALLIIGAFVLRTLADFSVRSSLENYYTSVEPIGLRLSGAMTFLFGMLYIQHHLTRIAVWKRMAKSCAR